MAPVIRTAEYALLDWLNGHVEVKANKLNQLVLTKAIADGYVAQHGDVVWITEAGLDRLAALED